MSNFLMRLFMSSSAKLVADTNKLLVVLDSPKPPCRDSMRDNKLQDNLAKNLGEMMMTLSGMNPEGRLVPKACAQLKQEIFRGDTLRLMILNVTELDFEARNYAAHIVAQLQKQSVNSELIASPVAGDYLERNKDLLEILVNGLESPETGIHYGKMLREFLLHETVAWYLFDSGCWRRLLHWIDSSEENLPVALRFDVVSNARETFKVLMTTHKTTVARYLAQNHNTFFDKYNSKLLESANIFNRKAGIKLLGDILVDPLNGSTKLHYISLRENLELTIRLLSERSQITRMEAFRVFKLFLENPDKPHDVAWILVTYQHKLKGLVRELLQNEGDRQEEKEQVVREINSCARRYLPCHLRFP